jgi:hypothetical protein
VIDRDPISLFDFEIDTGSRVIYRTAWGRDAEEAFGQLQFDFKLVLPLEPHDVLFEQMLSYEPTDGPPLVWWTEAALA